MVRREHSGIPSFVIAGKCTKARAWLKHVADTSRTVNRLCHRYLKIFFHGISVTFLILMQLRLCKLRKGEERCFERTMAMNVRMEKSNLPSSLSLSFGYGLALRVVAMSLMSALIDHKYFYGSLWNVRSSFSR